MKFQTSNSSMLVGMPWLWSCWLDRPWTTWEFQAKIWGIWWIQLEFLILDPFSLCHFFEPVWYMKYKNPHFLVLPQGAKMSDPNLYDFLNCVSVTDLHLYTCGTVKDLFRCSLVKILMAWPVAIFSKQPYLKSTIYLFSNLFDNNLPSAPKI